MRIDHVQLAAPPNCEEQAHRFFVDILGLRPIPKPPALAKNGGAWFALASGELHVGVDRNFSPAKKAHAALALDSEAALQALAARLSEAGHPIRWDERLEGVRRFFTEDPWGNRLELLARAGD